MNMILKTLSGNAQKLLIFKLYKYYIIDSVIIIKNEGFKSLLRQRGWKFLLIIVGYYAVRDSVVYIIIPLMIAKGLL